MYFAVVVLVVVTHFTFTIYVVVGGLLALRWRRTIVLHVLAVIWAVAIETVNFPCPLSTIERWGRRSGGMAPLPADGFIAHYITGVNYPAAWVGAVQAIAVAVVALSWILYRREGRRLMFHRRNAKGGRRGFPVTCPREAQSPPWRTARAVPVGSPQDR